MTSPTERGGVAVPVSGLASYGAGIASPLQPQQEAQLPMTMAITDTYRARLARDASGDDLARLADHVQELALAAAVLDLWDRGAIRFAVDEDGRVTYAPAIRQARACDATDRATNADPPVECFTFDGRPLGHVPHGSVLHPRLIADLDSRRHPCPLCRSETAAGANTPATVGVAP